VVVGILNDYDAEKRTDLTEDQYEGFVTDCKAAVANVSGE